MVSGGTEAFKRKEERGNFYVAFICGRFRLLCRGDFHPGKMRDPEDRLDGGYCCADSGDPGFFLDHGIFCRVLEPAFFRKGQYPGFSDPFRRSYGSFLAVLF